MEVHIYVDGTGALHLKNEHQENPNLTYLGMVFLSLQAPDGIDPIRYLDQDELAERPNA